MRCEICKTPIRYRGGCWGSDPKHRLCQDCFEEEMEQRHVVDFRFNDIEGSLQYIRTAKRETMDEQEGRMQ